MGERTIETLTSDIEEYTGKIAELKDLLKNAKEEKNKDFEGLEKSSEMRMKEGKEFHQTEKDLLGAIASCKQAIIVLSKHNPELYQVRNVVRSLQGLPSSIVAKSLNDIQTSTFKSFLQEAQHADSFLQIRGLSAAPQSGQVFGMLKQMKEDFEKNLKETQEAEAKAKTEFADLKSSKEAEIAAGKKQIDQADEDVAQFTEKKAQAEDELSDTEEQVKTDTIFLQNLQKQCAAQDKEYQIRLKDRLAEIEAVQDTIGFLNSDEAHAMFDKTVNSASFVQVRAHSQLQESAEDKWMRHKLVHALQRAGSPRLVMLVTSARLDAFTEVKKEIDKMIAELKQQSADEVKKKDFCIDELNKVELKMEKKDDHKAKTQSKIDDLESTISTFTKDIAAKKGEIADMQEEMKRGSEDREAENADYQQAVMDQRIAQSILTKALDRMKAQYALVQKQAEDEEAREEHKHQVALQQMKMLSNENEQLSMSDKVLEGMDDGDDDSQDDSQPGAPQMQLSGTDTEPGSAPARFNKMEKNSGGKKVLGMIQDVIDDSKKAEAEAIAAEQDAVAAYENFMKDSNKSITELTKAINNMSEELAKTKEALVAAQENLAQVMTDIQDLTDTKADLHKECDFLLKNFEVRQAARQDEVDALNEAKNILSGAK
jgi:chromosome segregation ATPase